MPPEHRARVMWSPAQVRRRLPPFERTTDPAWFEADPPGADGWSLVCHFEPPPAAQGNPSVARVAFVMPTAPHARLTPGVRLRVFERGSGDRALVEILG